jgi:hypothetical protein
VRCDDLGCRSAASTTRARLRWSKCLDDRCAISSLRHACVKHGCVGCSSIRVVAGKRPRRVGGIGCRRQRADAVRRGGARTESQSARRPRRQRSGQRVQEERQRRRAVARWYADGVWCASGVIACVCRQCIHGRWRGSATQVTGRCGQCDHTGHVAMCNQDGAGVARRARRILRQWWQCAENNRLWRMKSAVVLFTQFITDLFASSTGVFVFSRKKRA